MTNDDDDHVDTTNSCVSPLCLLHYRFFMVSRSHGDDMRQSPMLESLGSTLQMSVKTLKGNTTTLEVKASNTIKSVETKVRCKAGIAPNLQMLVFGCKCLEHGRTLSEYNVEKETSLRMIAGLLGGSSKPKLGEVNVVARCSRRERR